MCPEGCTMKQAGHSQAFFFFFQKASFTRSQALLRDNKCGLQLSLLTKVFFIRVSARSYHHHHHQVICLVSLPSCSNCFLSIYFQIMLGLWVEGIVHEGSLFVFMQFGLSIVELRLYFKFLQYHIIILITDLTYWANTLYLLLLLTCSIIAGTYSSHHLRLWPLDKRRWDTRKWILCFLKKQRDMTQGWTQEYTTAMEHSYLCRRSRLFPVNHYLFILF